ncbi:MAG TPA: O-antigen ligase family protein [Bryobacteraceae bacterium]|nr:O-antigen ligase family protein [Bryobacteraceae bacterium]
MGLALIFVKFSLLQEILGYLLGFNAGVLYVFGIPALLGVIVAGGVPRTLQGHPSRFWLAFGFWLAMTIPFSSWQGGSFHEVFGYWKGDLPMMFVVGGLAVSWKECRLLMKTIGLASLVNLMSTRAFAQSDTGRLAWDFHGSISNANDLAAHLLLVLSFLLFVVHTSKSLVQRVVLFLIWGYGMIIVIRTGSRGGLLAIAVCCLFALLRGTKRQRAMLFVIIPVGIMAALMFVPSDVLKRIGAFSTSSTSRASAQDGQGVELEAEESKVARQDILSKAIEYAIQNPVFGVGAGQFGNYEGTHNLLPGATHGYWHNVHNSFLAPFVEAGVIGGLLHLSAYIFGFVLLNRTFRKAKLRPDCRDIQTATFYAMMAWVGFSVAIFFLNFSYTWYGPAFGGMSVSIWQAAEYEFVHRSSRAVAAA